MEQPQEVAVAAGVEPLPRHAGKLRGKHAQGVRDQLARLLRGILAEQLRRPHPLGGGLQ